MLLLHGSIAIPRPINGSDDFARLLHVWTDVAPSLLPTYADDHEPVSLRSTPHDQRTISINGGSAHSGLDDARALPCG
jgi:hypothetical protein